MKTCRQCTRLDDGICSHYRKPPPKDFAERCARYEQGEVEPEVESPGCKDCHRFDRDDTGEWCLVSNDGEVITSRPIREGIVCPLNRIKA